MTTNAVQDGQSPPATPAPSPAAPVLMSLRFVGQGDVEATLDALRRPVIVSNWLWTYRAADKSPAAVARRSALLRTLKEIAND